VKLTDEQVCEYAKNLLVYGTVFVQVNWVDGEVVVKILSNEEVTLENKDENSLTSL
jgi:hypothetical protein